LLVLFVTAIPRSKHSIVPVFRLPKLADERFALQHHLFGHLVKVRVWSVVHHRVGKHEEDIPLILVGVGHPTVSYFGFDRLEVNCTFDDFVIIRGV